MAADRHDLRTADPARLCNDAAERLRAGQPCVLPTETSYVVAALPQHAGAVAAVRQAARLGADAPLTRHVADRAAAAALWRSVPPPVGRLLDRYWPGPLTVLLPGRDGSLVGVRVPAHPFTRRLLAALGQPLATAPAPGDDGRPLCDAIAVQTRLHGTRALVVDDGPSPLATPTTVVRLDGPRLAVPREGILTAGEVLHTAARRIVFVCTGNTCRSPLAEVIARELCAKALGVPAADVLACGLSFASAGTGTMDGMPASDGSLAAAREIDLDLSGHQSRMLDRNTIERADRVYCLAASHQRAILSRLPAAKDKVELLRPDGGDIADPYGSDLDAYRRTREEIQQAIGLRLDGWLAG
jgi:tRNA threonylcarbamoyl adenosine modification protein (Sua5/YciO/YrdC/YwlC family)